MKVESYVISLNNPIRLLSKLKKCGLNPKLIHGINGKIINKEVIDKHVSKLYSLIGPKSAIGCALSHIAVWKTFLKSKEKFAIIFEDDIIFDDQDLNKMIVNYINKTPKNFDMLYLGYFGENIKDENGKIFNLTMRLFGNTNKKSVIINDTVCRPEVALAMHSYVLSRKGARKLIGLLDGNIYHHIDYCIQNLYSRNLINSFAVYPKCIFQTSTYKTCSSNVSSQHPILFNKILSNYMIDHKVTANYLTTLSVIRIFDINLTISSIIFFILGYIFAIIGVDNIHICLFYILISLQDQLIPIMVLNYSMFVLPTLIKN